MFESEYGDAAVEVLDILDNTNKEDVSKIPQSFIEFLVSIASPEYRVDFDHSKKIGKLNIKEKTKELLGVIYINWWCDKNKQEEYKKQIKELEINKQKEIQEKYNPNKIFENKKQENISESHINIVQNEAVAMVEYKENIFKRIWKNILKYFKN